MALQRGGLSALTACRALRAAGPARSLHLLPAAGFLAPPHAAHERRPLRSWLWAALAPVALSASRAARASGVRSLHVSCCTDGNLPATFVAPTKVNMDDYPPPKRRLSKGASSPEQRSALSLLWRVLALVLASPLTPATARAAHADDVIVQFVRSGGAGGQNVNKGARPR